MSIYYSTLTQAKHFDIFHRKYWLNSSELREPHGRARYRIVPDVIDPARLLACRVVCCSYKSDFLVNNVYLIVYSNCITQNEILKLLRRIHVAPSATVSELFTQFKGSFDVFKNNSCFSNMPVFHFERFRLRSLLLYSLGLWILFFFFFSFCFSFINKFDLS